MPTMQVEVVVSELMEAIGLETLPEDCAFRTNSRVDISALVDEGDIVSAGYTPDDEVPDADEMLSDALRSIETDAMILKDGLRALMEGDRAMAAVLIERALKEWPDAALAAEEVILGRTVHDRRQGALALAA